MKSLATNFSYVEIPQSGYMEHGLKYFKFYVQKHISPLAICYNPLLDHNEPLWSFVRLIYSEMFLLCGLYESPMSGLWTQDTLKSL